MLKVTMIGSRDSNEEEDKLFVMLGHKVVSAGGMVISGGAIGKNSLSPDSASEKGALIAMQSLGLTDRLQVILPWSGFPREAPKYPDGKHYFLLDETMDALAEDFLRANQVVHHNIIGRGMPKLFRRNVYQILTMDYSMTDVVIFAAPEKNGKVKGGTAVAVELARSFGVPTFNTRDPEQTKKLKAFLKERKVL